MQACLFSLYLNIRLFRFVHSLHEVQRGVSIHASAFGTGAGTSALQPASGAAAGSTMKAILLEVMRKSAGTANAGHEYRLLRRKLFVAAQPQQGRQDCVIAAAHTPAPGAALVVPPRCSASANQGSADSSLTP